MPSGPDRHALSWRPSLHSGEAPDARRLARVASLDGTVSRRAISRRVGDMAWHLVGGDLPAPAVRLVVMMACLCAIGALAAAGSATAGKLAILYFVPPMVASVLVGRDLGVALSAAAAVAWSITRTSWPLWELSTSAALRFAVMALFVVAVCALRRAAVEARLSDERTTRFLALAAHQLRNPVAGIRSSAEALSAVLGDEASWAVRERLLSNLVSESARAGRLVDDLLAISSVEQARPLPVVPVDLATVARECVDQLARRHPRLLIEASIPDSAIAKANRASCLQVLEHLLDNAARHARGQIWLELKRAGQSLFVCVADDGPGLPSGHETDAFEPFVSLDGRGGSGLGLPLSRGLARSFGGDLGYDSGRFVLCLPSADEALALADAEVFSSLQPSLAMGAPDEGTELPA